MILAVIHGLGGRGEGKVTVVPSPLPNTYTRESSEAKNPKSCNRMEKMKEKETKIPSEFYGKYIFIVSNGDTHILVTGISEPANSQSRHRPHHGPQDDRSKTLHRSREVAVGTCELPYGRRR